MTAFGRKDSVLDMDAKFERALEAFQSALQSLWDDGHTIDVMMGRKYVRVIVRNPAGESRSVHSFIEISTGDVYKAASWKAPARNVPRGNIYQDDPMKGCNKYGANYL